jgi:hypothetical protein
VREPKVTDSPTRPAMTEADKIPESIPL